MSLLDSILSILGRNAESVAADLIRDKLRGLTGSGSSGSSRSSRRSTATSTASTTARSTRKRGSSRSTHPAEADSYPHDGASPYDVAALGLPDFQYSPKGDGDADPGEVVWTWVPYEEDTSQGKDRPVLVLSRHEGKLVVAQLTSKDHDRDAEQEASQGRFWFDVGSGPWDSRGRRSEMRLDRLLLVDPAAVRREGSTMPRVTFEAATQALRRHWA